MVKPVKNLTDADFRARIAERTASLTEAERAERTARGARIHAEYLYIVKYQDARAGETALDLTEMLTDNLNLVDLGFPDTNLPDEEWLKYITYYLERLTMFMSLEMGLDEKLVQPLHEIKSLLHDLHSGRRNVHIPQGRRARTAPQEAAGTPGRGVSVTPWPDIMEKGPRRQRATPLSVVR